MESKKLNDTFKGKKIDTLRLSSNREFLSSMGLNPEFEKKCLAIFTEIGATSDEIIKISSVIEEQNECVEKGIVGLNTKRDGRSYGGMIKIAADNYNEKSIFPKNGASDDFYDDDRKIV